MTINEPVKGGEFWGYDSTSFLPFDCFRQPDKALTCVRPVPGFALIMAFETIRFKLLNQAPKKNVFDDYVDYDN